MSNKGEWWVAGMVICLMLGADLHMAKLIPLPLTVSCCSKSGLVLPFWYHLSQIVPDRGPLTGVIDVVELQRRTVLGFRHQVCFFW